MKNSSTSAAFVFPCPWPLTVTPPPDCTADSSKWGSVKFGADQRCPVFRRPSSDPAAPPVRNGELIMENFSVMRQRGTAAATPSNSNHGAARHSRRRRLCACERTRLTERHIPPPEQKRLIARWRATRGAFPLPACIATAYGRRTPRRRGARNESCRLQGRVRRPPRRGQRRRKRGHAASSQCTCQGRRRFRPGRSPCSEFAVLKIGVTFGSLAGQADGNSLNGMLRRALRPLHLHDRVVRREAPRRGRSDARRYICRSYRESRECG